MREYLKRNGADPTLIERLERLLQEASPILSLAGAVLGLYVFARGELVLKIVTSDLVLQRILHRFETSGMKQQLERILHDLLDPNLRRAIEDDTRRRTQPRGPGGKFQEKEPGQEAPGSIHEEEVCKRVRQSFRFAAEQVRIKRYAPAGSLPGQPPRVGLVLADPVVKVDCVGAKSPMSGLVLFEAKESAPPDFTNPGLTAAQRIVYPELLRFGGEIVTDNGPFRAGTKLPKGTRVRIITPSNLGDVR